MDDTHAVGQASGAHSPVDNHRRCVLVPAMHRSGSSAVTRVISLLGADLPNGLMPPTEANPKGYWESSELADLHDQLLISGGSRWDDWAPFLSEERMPESQEATKTQIGSLLEREFSDSTLFVIKDPRICRFVPIWLDVLSSFSARPSAVIPVRHPFEVANSLQTRDGIPFAKGCLLWLRHVIDAERSTRRIPRVFVDFEKLLADWPSEVGKIVEHLGISWPRSLEEASKAISEFLSAELRHFVSKPHELDIRSDIVAWVRRTYQAILRLAAGGKDEATYRELDQIHSEFDNACQAFGDLIRSERQNSAQEALATVTVVTRGDFNAHIQHVEQRMSTFGQSLGSTAQESRRQQDELNQFVRDWMARADQSDCEVKRVADLQSEMATRLEQTTGQVGDIVGRQNEMATRIEQTSGQVDGVVVRQDQLAAQVEQSAQKVSRVEDRQDELAARIAQTAGEVSDVADGQNELQLRVVESARQVRELSVEMSKQLAAAGQMNAGLNTCATELEDLRSRLSAHEQFAENLRRETVQCTEAISDLPSVVAERERGSSAQIDQLQDALAAAESEIAQFQSFSDDVLARMESLQTQLEDQRRKSLSERLRLAFRKLRPITKPVERVLRASRDLTVGLVTLRWLRVSRHELRLPYYKKQLLSTGLFDPEWYLEQNSDVAASGIDAWEHWLEYGVAERRNPNPYFDTAWYLERCPHLEETGQNPLVHYLRRGARDGVDPGRRFQTHAYVREHRDVLGRRQNPLAHFLQNQPRPSASTDATQQQPPEASVLVESRPVETTVSAPQTGWREVEPVFEEEQHPQISNPPAKLIAFYLPQFHPIAENDQWWGKGFTEWTNVTKGTPSFDGHYQPHLPGEFGFYDLRVPEVMARQVQLAAQYGIHGFCFYYYWFGGKRLLEKPLDMFLEHPEWDFPFCVCWANENWTRRWNGDDQQILMAQTHSPEDDLACIEDLSRYLRDPRCIRVDGKPMLIVYRVGILPDAAATAQRWREYCRQTGLGEIVLVAAQTFGTTDPRPYGFDAAVEFPPHGISTSNITSEMPGLHPDFNGSIFSYSEIPDSNPPQAASYPLYKGVCASWDNTARRGLSAHVFAGGSPQNYERWLDQAVAFTKENNPPRDQFVFVNAWNEWAEGTHLEPDAKWGYAYLNATARVLSKHAVEEKPETLGRVCCDRDQQLVSIVIPSYNHERYIVDCLDSVRRQQLRRIGSEVIVVDDGSTDRTAQRVEDYIRSHPELTVRLIKQSNAGAHAAINRGIKASRGAYVTILNSDDQYRTDRIQTLYDALRDSGQGLCFSDFDVFDDDSRAVDDGHAYVRHLRENQARINEFPSLGYALLTFNSAISTGNLFFTRELYERIGGFAEFRYCHDWDFVLSSLEYTTPVYVDERLYRYRLHQTNTFSSLGQSVAEEDSRHVLAKAASRILAGNGPDAYPSLTESTEYLATLMESIGHPIRSRLAGAA